MYIHNSNRDTVSGTTYGHYVLLCLMERSTTRVRTPLLIVICSFVEILFLNTSLGGALGHLRYSAPSTPWMRPTSVGHLPGKSTLDFLFLHVGSVFVTPSKIVTLLVPDPGTPTLLVQVLVILFGPAFLSSVSGLTSQPFPG